MLIRGNKSWRRKSLSTAPAPVLSVRDRAVFINVDKDPEKLDEMLSLSGGRRQVPVIVEGDKVTVGFVGET